MGKKQLDSSLAESSLPHNSIDMSNLQFNACLVSYLATLLGKNIAFHDRFNCSKNTLFSLADIRMEIWRSE